MAPGALALRAMAPLAMASRASAPRAMAPGLAKTPHRPYPQRKARAMNAGNRTNTCIRIFRNFKLPKGISHSGVCEINAHRVEGDSAYIPPRTPELNVEAFTENTPPCKDGRLFRSALKPPGACANIELGGAGGRCIQGTTCAMGVFFADTGYQKSLQHGHLKTRGWPAIGQGHRPRPSALAVGQGHGHVVAKATSGQAMGWPWACGGHVVAMWWPCGGYVVAM